MAASTKSTIGLIIDSTAYQQSTTDYLESLHKTGQLCVTQLLIISEQQGVPKRYFTKLGKLYPNTSLQRVATRTNISEFLKNLQADLVGYIPSGATPSLQLPDIASVKGEPEK